MEMEDVLDGEEGTGESSSAKVMVGSITSGADLAGGMVSMEGLKKIIGRYW